MNYTAKEIANILRGTVEGDETVIINSVSKIEEGKNGDLCFLSNAKYNSYLYSCKASVIIVNNNFQLEDKVDSTLIRVENSYLAFSQLLSIYNKTSSKKSGISEKSMCHTSIGWNPFDTMRTPVDSWVLSTPSFSKRAAIPESP